MATLTALPIIILATIALAFVGYRLHQVSTPHPENSTVKAHFSIQLYALASFTLCGIIGTQLAILLGY